MSCSDTRQIDRLESLTVFKLKLFDIHCALKEIENWKDAKSSEKATRRLSSIETFDFVLYLVFLEDVLQVLKPLATLLQQANIDLYYALNEVKKHANILKEKLESKDALRNFNVLMDEIQSIYSKMMSNNSMYIGRILRHAQVKEYFSMYVNFINSFVENLESRLSKREYLSSKISKLHPNFVDSIDDFFEWSSSSKL